MKATDSDEYGASVRLAVGTIQHVVWIKQSASDILYHPVCTFTEVFEQLNVIP